MLITESLSVKKSTILDNMIYIPSPIHFSCNFIFIATANRSGRMQYHKLQPGVSKERITRNEFCDAYNNSKIIGVKPLQTSVGSSVFQMEFYI